MGHMAKVFEHQAHVGAFLGQFRLIPSELRWEDRPGLHLSRFERLVVQGVSDMPHDLTGTQSSGQGQLDSFLDQPPSDCRRRAALACYRVDEGPDRR